MYVLQCKETNTGKETTLNDCLNLGSTCDFFLSKLTKYRAWPASYCVPCCCHIWTARKFIKSSSCNPSYWLDSPRDESNGANLLSSKTPPFHWWGSGSRRHVTRPDVRCGSEWSIHPQQSIQYGNANRSNIWDPSRSYGGTRPRKRTSGQQKKTGLWGFRIALLVNIVLQPSFLSWDPVARIV